MEIRTVKQRNQNKFSVSLRFCLPFHKLPFRSHSPNLLERALPRWITYHDNKIKKLVKDEIWWNMMKSLDLSHPSGSRAKLIDGLWGVFFAYTIKTHRLPKKIVQYKVSFLHTKTHRVQHFEQGRTREHNTCGWSQGSTFSNSSCTWGRVQSHQLAEGQSLKTQRSLSWKSI